MPYVWGILAFIFFLFSLVMFIGMFSPKLINKRLRESQNPFTRKRAAILWIVFGFIFFIFVGLSNPTPDKGVLASPANAATESSKASNEPKPTKALKTTGAPKVTTPAPTIKATPVVTVKPSSKPTSTPIPTVDPAVQKKKDQQAIVLQFEQTIYDTEKPATVAIKNYQAVFQDYGAGTATINDAYQAATDANKACGDVQYAMGTLSTPSGLPKDVKNSLSGATDDISTSYYTTTEALDQILKYLDDPKPSYVQKYKDDMAMANSFIISGVQKILEAKTEMGIDITTASPSA